MNGLKNLREKRLITQEELAAASGLAVATVSRLERGKARPSLKTVRRLAKALDVDPLHLREVLMNGQSMFDVDQAQGL